MNPTPTTPATNRALDLEQLSALLRRRIGLILLCLTATVIVTVGVSLLQQKMYSASASLLFRESNFAQSLFGGNAPLSGTDPTRDAATNAKLVGLDVIAAKTASVLPERFSAEDVSDMIDVSPVGLSDIVTVTATAPEPVEAKRVANIFARQFVIFRANADKSKLLLAQQLAEREFSRLSKSEQQGVRGESLSRAAERLGVLASLQTGNAELVQPAALPTSPSSPKPGRNAALGALLGLILGVGLAFLAERFNRRLRDAEEARIAFGGLPVLATIPESKAIMTSNAGSVATPLPFKENEAFRMLRASLRYFNVDDEKNVLLVTSNAASVGKSTIAWNLARVAATSSRVVVIETDLRNPTLARQHGLKFGPGLAELLTHQVEMSDVIQSKSIATAGQSETSAELDVVVAGSIPPNPAELIESQTMSDVLAQLTERYELVVIDTPPIGVVSDAFPLLRRVDGVIVVMRMGKTTRDAAERLREQLDRLEAPVLGLVANGVKADRSDEYGYGYYESSSDLDKAQLSPAKSSASER